tara:strand:- start:545 stop:784 length:240 start_codon:yes stop_codon:yes gene_type:complete
MLDSEKQNLFGQVEQDFTYFLRSRQGGEVPPSALIFVVLHVGIDWYLSLERDRFQAISLVISVLARSVENFIERGGADE